MVVHGLRTVMVCARCWHVGRLPLPFALERTCAVARSRGDDAMT
jgi:hypothetical protein